MGKVSNTVVRLNGLLKLGTLQSARSDTYQSFKRVSTPPYVTVRPGNTRPRHSANGCSRVWMSRQTDRWYWVWAPIYVPILYNRKGSFIFRQNTGKVPSSSDKTQEPFQNVKEPFQNVIVIRRKGSLPKIFQWGTFPSHQGKVKIPFLGDLGTFLWEKRTFPFVKKNLSL